MTSNDPPPPHPEPGDQPDADSDEMIMVACVVTPGGEYTVQISRGDTHIGTLTVSAARKYVEAFNKHIAYARYDAAVLAQLREAKIDNQGIYVVMQALRKVRGTVPPVLTKPIRVTPIVSSRTGEAVLQCEVEGVEGWQFSAADAIQHVRQVIEVAEGSQLDRLYYRVLRTAIDLDEPTARAMVGSLINFHGQD